MKICFITEAFPPSLGGVERHAQRVAQVLAERSHDIVVLTTVAEHVVRQDGPPRIYRLLKKPSIVGMWPVMIRNAWLLRQADVIHCHDVGTFYWYLPFRFLWPRKPVFVTFHGWEGHIPPRLRFVAMRQAAERMSAGSIAVGKFISKWYHQRPTIITYGGVDALPWNGEKDASRAVFVGQLREDTGIRLYLQAMAELQRDQLVTRLDVVGDGPLRDALSAQAQREGLPVTFHGPQVDPRPHLQRARYAFVSGYLTMLEAMASDAIVAAVYDNPIKQDYLRLSPFAAHALMESSASGLAAKIRDLASQPEEMARWVREARIFATARTWESVADQYEDLWRASK